MAINYLSPINFNNQELRGVVIQRLAVAPSSPSVGQIYYNTADETIYMCTDDAAPYTWVSLGGDITAVNAGNGLTGGGDSGDVTINVGAGDAIGVGVDSISVLYGAGLRLDGFNQLEVRVDDTSIELDGTNQLSLKVTGVALNFSGNSERMRASSSL